MRERPASDVTTVSGGTTAAPTERRGDRFERSAPPGLPKRLERLVDKLERLGDRLADGDNVEAKIGKVLTRLEGLFARYLTPKTTSPAPAPAPAPDAAAPPPSAPVETVAPPAVVPAPASTDPVLIAALPFAEPAPTTTGAAPVQTLDLVA